MQNRIQKHLLRTLVFMLMGGLIAVIIWYFTGAHTLQRLASILFWTGCTLIIVSVLMFAGGNKNPSAGKRFNGSNIGMSFGKQLDTRDAMNRSVNDKVETTLLQIAGAGGLLLVARWLIVAWF